MSKSTGKLKPMKTCTACVLLILVIFSIIYASYEPMFSIDYKDISTRSRRASVYYGDNSALRLPTRPLHAHNMWVVLKSPQKELIYENVTGGFKNHPHLGGRDNNGAFGYVVDETALRKNPPGFGVTAQELKFMCDIHDANWELLTKKIRIDRAAHKKAEREAESGLKKRAKIFCLVYTIEEFHYKIPSIKETWGSKCDGFMVASNKTDAFLGAVDIPHEGPEIYRNIWQKVRSMWSYVYDNYYDEYDWFHIGGDDLYLLVENLRLYLESEEIQLASNGGLELPIGNETEETPLYLGRRFKYNGDGRQIYQHGGAGYTINKAALKVLVVDALPLCERDTVWMWEDVLIGQCFREQNIFAFDTRNERGEERYMPMKPIHHM